MHDQIVHRKSARYALKQALQGEIGARRGMNAENAA
jgi:hypothetical protein